MGDIERLCAVEPHLRPKRFSPPELEAGNVGSAGQRLPY